ncbi:hypothetical protein EV361DRAFT_955076 [Lentinula raphanica]|nr:hypothetical protein EV361DRAFT_955076 [Lentinula raphanica]
MSSRPHPPRPAGRSPFVRPQSHESEAQNHQLDTPPSSQAPPRMIARAPPTSNTATPQSNNEDSPQVPQQLTKRKYDQFKEKAAQEKLNRKYNVLDPFIKAGKYWCFLINPVNNIKSTINLGISKDYKAQIALQREERRLQRQAERQREAEHLGVNITELEDDLPQEDDSEEDDDLDDLDDSITSDEQDRLETHKRRRIDDYSKFLSTFPKLTKRLLETVQNKDIETFNACVGVIHEMRDGIQRRNSSVLKDRVLQWIPKIWHLKTKENKGEFPFPETGRVDNVGIQCSGSLAGRHGP